MNILVDREIEIIIYTKNNSQTQETKPTQETKKDTP